MIKFDTLKIGFPREYVENINLEDLNKSKDKNGNEYYWKNKIGIGFTELAVKRTEVIVKFSAKILRQDYPQLLTINTILKALSNLAEVTPFDFEPHRILDIAHVYLAHQAKHITVNKPLSEYKYALNHAYISPKYKPDYHADETITFNLSKKTKNSSEYFKIYNKEIEYALPHNRNFRNSLTNKENELIKAQFHNKFKVETELSSKRKLRQYFIDIQPQIYLQELLNSSCNAIAEQFDKITKHMFDSLEVKEIDKSTNFAQSLNFNDAQIFNTLKVLDFNSEAIDKWLKHKVPSRASLQRKRKSHFDILAKFNAHHISNSAEELLYELRDKICTINETVEYIAEKTTSLIKVPHPDDYDENSLPF